MFCSDSKRVKHGIFPLIFIGITQEEPYQDFIHSFISFHLQEKCKYWFKKKKNVQNAITISNNYTMTKNHKKSLIFNNADKNNNDNNQPFTSQQCKTDSPYLNKNSSNHCWLSLACVPIPQCCKKKGLSKICETWVLMVFLPFNWQWCKKQTHSH